MSDRKDEATIHPANKLANVKRRVDRARNFPVNTCGASRHLHIIADILANSRKQRANIEDIYDPEHMAGSIYSVLESLWKARTEIARLKSGIEASSRPLRSRIKRGKNE